MPVNLLLGAVIASAAPPGTAAPVQPEDPLSVHCVSEGPVSITPGLALTVRDFTFEPAGPMRTRCVRADGVAIAGPVRYTFTGHGRGNLLAGSGSTSDFTLTVPDDGGDRVLRGRDDFGYLAVVGLWKGPETRGSFLMVPLKLEGLLNLTGAHLSVEGDFTLPPSTR